MSLRPPARLLLPLSLALSACDPTEPKGADTGEDGAADGADGSADGGDGAADGADGGGAPAAGCVAALPSPRTIGPAGGVVEVRLDGCADPVAAAELGWTPSLGALRSVALAGDGLLVSLEIADDPDRTPSPDLGLSLDPSDGGAAVPVRLRAHAGTVEVPAPPLHAVDAGPLDLRLPFAAAWAPPTEAGGRAWVSQVQGDELVVAPLQLEGGACADCALRLPWEPGAAARRHLWAPSARGELAVGGPLLVSFVGDGLQLTVHEYVEGEAPRARALPLDVADGLKELAAAGTVTAVHELAGLAPRDPADRLGVALLVTVENARGSYFALMVNDVVTVSASFDGLTPAEVAAGQGVVGLLGDTDHRAALVREVTVGTLRAAELDAGSCTLPLKVWERGEEGMRVRRQRRLRDACHDMGEAGLLHTADDPDGRPLDVVVLGEAGGDRLWVGAADTTELPPVSGLPAVYYVDGAVRGGPELPDSGVDLGAARAFNKGKVLTSDGLEYDRAGARLRGRGPIQLTGRSNTLRIAPAGAGFAADLSAALLRKELDKSTPILYSLAPPPGLTPTIAPAPDDRALTPGEPLELALIDGGLYATRTEHPDAALGEAATVELAGANGALYAIVVAINNTKKDPATPDIADLVSAEGASFYAGAVMLNDVDSAIFGVETATGAPLGCALSEEEALRCATGALALDALRWAPQEGGGLAAVAQRGGAAAVLRWPAGTEAGAVVADGAWERALSGEGSPALRVAAKHPRGPYPVGTTQITYVAARADASSGALAGGLRDALLALVADDSPCGASLMVFADADGALRPEDGQLLARPTDAGCADLPEPVGFADLLGSGSPQALLWSAAGGLELLVIDAEGGFLRQPLGVAIGATAIELSAADLDGDGLDDLFVRQAGLDVGALLLHSDGAGGVTAIDVPEGALTGLAGLPAAAPGLPQRLPAVRWAAVQPDLRR